LDNHRLDVWDLAYSPDGAVLASAGFDNSVILWDTQAQFALGQLHPAHNGEVLSLRYVDDTLLSAGAETILSWQAEDSRPQMTIDDFPVASLAISPDGGLAAAGGLDGSLQLWDIASGAPVALWRDRHSNAVTALAFSPAGDRLVSGDDNGAILQWDLSDLGAESPVPLAFDGHSDGIQALVYSPDGKTLASGGKDNSLILWDSSSGLPRFEPLPGHTSRILEASFRVVERGYYCTQW
jgi:WD40 repeat protein